VNLQATEAKLRKLSYSDMQELKRLIAKVESEQPKFVSNTTDHPDTISRSLGEMFGNAWIHG